MERKDAKVVARSFPGAKVRQMKYYVKTSDDDNPSLYILHVGSNDMKENISVEKIDGEITSLARLLQIDATLHTNDSNLHPNQVDDSILAKFFLREICM